MSIEIHSIPTPTYVERDGNGITMRFGGPDPEERQVAPTLDGIRRDHVARYEWAASMLEPGEVVLDIGCGVGYGSHILAAKAAGVLGMDRDASAISYAERHYKAPNIAYRVRDFGSFSLPSTTDQFTTAVCFEVIEHIEDPVTLLSDLDAQRLFVSVPNEHVFPWHDGIKFHHRHYTPEDFENLLNVAGWEVVEWWAQAGPESEPVRDTQGRTQIAVCTRAERPVGGTWRNLPPPPDVRYTVSGYQHPTGKAPETVMLVGLGPSKYELTEAMLRHDFTPWWDELWTINKGIDFLPRADVAMILDDLYDYAERHPAYGQSMRDYTARGGRIISQTSLPNDGSIEFTNYPLREVLAFWQAQGGNPQNWLHTISVGLIMAYAGMIGVKRLMLAGIDCSWPNRPDLSEAGNAVVCYWIGRLEQLGCTVEINSDSTLNSTRNFGRYEWRQIYGYLRQPA